MGLLLRLTPSHPLRHLKTSTSWRLLVELRRRRPRRRQTLLRRFGLGETSLSRLELLVLCKLPSLWTQTLR
jgi:hypothetical protein